MIPLDRLVREPSDQAVAASFRRLNAAICSGDQAQIDLVLAEIDGAVPRADMSCPFGACSQARAQPDAEAREEALKGP